MGCKTARRLLVIHALSGCDTTSAVFGHGKVSAFKKLSANSLGNLCDAVSSSDSSQSDVGHAGCQLLVALYGGTVGVESLDKLRYTTYMKLCSSKQQLLHNNYRRHPELLITTVCVRTTKSWTGSHCQHNSLIPPTGDGRYKVAHWFQLQLIRNQHQMICWK